MPRQGWFGRLNAHFHTHPRGRLHEMLFWLAIGLGFGAFAFFGWSGGDGPVSTPFALMFGVISLCFVGWAFLPRAKTKAAPPLPQGKRGEIAQKVRQSKAERKRKDDGLPPPPIRRG